jgi:hypothetical protein
MKHKRLLVSLSVFAILTAAVFCATASAAFPDEPVADLPAGQVVEPTTVLDLQQQAQLVSSTGGIRKSQYGPQRTDPAEGIPEHAYSPFDERNNRVFTCPPGGCEYEPGIVLIKVASPVSVKDFLAQGIWTGDAALDAALKAQGVLRLEAVFPSAQPPKSGEVVASPGGDSMPKPDLTRWFRATLPETADVPGVVAALLKSPSVDYAEPDYLRRLAGQPPELPATAAVPSAAELPGPGTDPLYSQQWHLAAAEIPQAWQWLSDHGLPPGGSHDIVVAVIDTGVELTHPDLAANLWTNSREIPGNNVDDDGNGYRDDVHGVDVILNSGNPMDDHGHGTHVAGIIGAQANNGIGGVGVAYNVQIMPIKAAQYSGFLATSDIAEGVYYAVAQGADVINMSFGGYARSQLEEDALAVAFGQAVLVAAAGNDGQVNLPCLLGRDMYPAAYNWVLGVMASKQDSSGTTGWRALFSNFDCVPHDSHEYEVMAPGVDIWSTLPIGQYAAWDGTSMSAPIVSGIAALLRTRFTDKDLYSSRFIMGQIASTATPLARAHAALTTVPTPELRYLEHWLLDTLFVNASNDNDGVADSGETIDLAITIRNHWGKADPVTVTLQAWAEGAYQPDPYVTMITETVDYGAIGSFSTDDNGLIIDAQGVITGVRHPFRFTVVPDCPNDHFIPFLLTLTYRNGMDPADTTVYTAESRFTVGVQRGRVLPRIISEDMTLTKDDYWLVPDQTLIVSGTTVAVIPGTQIQFWSIPRSDPLAPIANAYVQVEGTLVVQGTAEDPVELFPDAYAQGQQYRYGTVRLFEMGNGRASLTYARVMKPYLTDDQSAGISLVDHSYFATDGTCAPKLRPTVMSNSILHKLNGFSYRLGSWPEVMTVTTTLFDSTSVVLGRQHTLWDSVFLINYWPDGYAEYQHSSATVGYSCTACALDEGRAANLWHNNAILNRWWNPNPNQWMQFHPIGVRGSTTFITDNYWGGASSAQIDSAINDFNDDFNKALVIYQPVLVMPPQTAYPFVVDVVLSTRDLPDTTVIGAEPVTFTVTFNRDMSPTVQPQVSFGPDVPLTDYTIHPVNGGWQDARTWVGTFNITPGTGDGYQLIRVAGAVAADDPWLVTGDDAGRFRFEIITSGTEAMNLQSTGGEGYIDLTWTQNDFDLLAGFNLYRATSLGGTYSRINAGLLLPTQRALRDTAVLPGQPYFYKFTVVKTDMTESAPSNISQAAPIDTIPPTLTHTPLTGAASGLPLSLFADVTDNVGVQAVTLYFRSIGTTPYTARAMTHTTGNRYVATIESTRVAPPGLEYYIEAADGVSIARVGRPEYPYQVAVADRPYVTGVSPTRGPASGGTVLTVTGSNFKPGATVTLSGAACQGVAVLSTSQITCMTPPHFPAAVDVTVTNPDSQGGTLLRGYTYESDTASLSLPNTGGQQHAIVQVPINLSVQGLAAADITVTFNSAVLSGRGARTGTLTPGWTLVTNTTTAGQIRLSMSSTGGTVTGSGNLAILEFEVLGTPGVTTTLHVQGLSLNDGAIPVDVADGSFAVSLVCNVKGTVRYWSGSLAVPNVLLTLEGDRVYIGTSSATGVYTVSGAPSGDYVLSPFKSDQVAGITAYDASLVLQHSAGLISLSGQQAVAADVNKSGAINSMDAFYILQKAVSLIGVPFPGAGLVWEFVPATRSYTNLSGDQTGQDFAAILLGDVSGNWTAGGAAAAGNASGQVGVIRIQGMAPAADGTVVARVWLDSGGEPVYSLDLRIGYDPTHAKLLAVQSEPLAAGLASGVNASEPGEVRIALAGALPMTNSGPILSLRFQLTNPKRALLLDIQSAQANEGALPLRPDEGFVGGYRVHLPRLAW